MSASSDELFLTTVLNNPFVYLCLSKRSARLLSCLCVSRPTVADGHKDLLALITMALPQTRLLCKGTGLFLASSIRGNTHSPPPQALAPLCRFHHVGEGEHMDYMLCWFEQHKV